VVLDERHMGADDRPIPLRDSTVSSPLVSRPPVQARVRRHWLERVRVRRVECRSDLGCVVRGSTGCGRGVRGRASYRHRGGLGGERRRNRGIDERFSDVDID
jgi:hypothetical protein